MCRDPYYRRSRRTRPPSDRDLRLCKALCSSPVPLSARSLAAHRARRLAASHSRLTFAWKVLEECRLETDPAVFVELLRILFEILHQNSNDLLQGGVPFDAVVFHRIVIHLVYAEPELVSIHQTLNVRNATVTCAVLLKAQLS